MSRRETTNNRIRGPQSALTDFLASHNISANRIRGDHERRRQATLQQAGQDAPESDGIQIQNQAEDEEETAERRVQTKKRKRQTEKAVAKIKRSKDFKCQKAHLGGSPEGDEDEIALNIYEKSKPSAGQLENCEVCDKRFTVTAYSKTGPNGGLLCPKCSKEQEAERRKDVKPKKQSTNKLKQRQVKSNLLDGIVRNGPKTLQELCIEKIADRINDVDEFGDLPPALLDTLSQILSRRRIITSRTLDFFLRPELDKVAIYDCAKLETADFIKIFSIIPRVETIDLRNAGQIKDEVLDYIIERNVPIKHLQLGAANLVSDSKWREFFFAQGSNLQTLKLEWLDYSMDEETLSRLVASCPNLKRLKLSRCFILGDASLEAFRDLKNIEHLSLHFKLPTSPASLISLIEAVGTNLRTLSLKDFESSDDLVLSTIHSVCKNLYKFRFNKNDCCTDAAFASLFNDWANPPLAFVDLSDTRDVDCTNPDGPSEPIGLASEGFKALMHHSGKRLETLDIASCRHIPYESFADIFDGVKQYPALKTINISMLTRVDTTIIAGIFKSCPTIKKVTAFGCFNINDVIVPPEVALIGLPHTQDSIVQGDSWMEFMDSMQD